MPMFRNQVKKFHFIGIGGIGMSGIAEVLLNLGYQVSGSDIKPSEITEKLTNLGASIYYEHKKENVHGCDVVVYTAAVPETNPEIKEAKNLKIPVIPRPEMLNELIRLKSGIGITGTHGKTSTTSLVADIMGKAGFDPTMLVGGVIKNIGSNAKLGASEYLVFEACEAFGSLAYFAPQIVAVTNIDDDHLEYYKSMDALKKAFLTFINRIPFYGFAVLNGDDPNIQELIPNITKKYITFGLSKNHDYYAQDLSFRNLCSSFTLFIQGENKGRIEVALPGEHNVYNALAAIALTTELKIDLTIIQESLSTFHNADRRFQLVGEKKGIKVYDDYAHHPKEIEATIKAALHMKKNGTKRIIAVFQPHLYSRTKLHYKNFASALSLADITVLTDIYPAREKPIPGVSSTLIYDTMKENHYQNLIFIPDKACIAAQLQNTLQEGDVILTLGAGDINHQGQNILDAVDC